MRPPGLKQTRARARAGSNGARDGAGARDGDGAGAMAYSGMPNLPD